MARRDPLHFLAVPKLRMAQSTLWPEHRDGWSFVEGVVAERLCCDDGTAFVSSIEEQLYNLGPVTEPWVGVAHQVPVHDLRTYPDLTRLLQSESWRQSLPHCRGLWTLCNYTREFLQASGVPVPIGVLPYITPLDRPGFDLDVFDGAVPRVLHVGQYQRDFQAFFDLELPGWEKLLLKPPKWELRSKGLVAKPSVRVLERTDNAGYDELLTNCVVAFTLKDAAANTAIVECMARATPVCVNRVGGVVEYLGNDYPLYHDGDMASVLQDRARLRSAHAYLAERRASLPRPADLIERMQSGAAYLALPVPRSTQTLFPRFELTVLIAVYNRLHGLHEQLERLARQDDPPRFELILWNNKPENAAAVDELSSKFRHLFPIHVIDSSENIYCAMRMAVPAFARADTLLFCDDDVLPEPQYLRRLYDAHRQLGPRSVVCLRGHVIRDHVLDLDHPERAWETERDMTFHDESAPDCTVDFAHADNLVISAQLLREASAYPMSHPEYVLVDDYWLSYVLSAQLGVNIRKIEGADILSFTASADDPAVAMYHNPHVHEQRVRLYIEHMRAGWPRRRGPD